MPKYISTVYVTVASVLLKRNKKYSIPMPAFIEDKIKIQEDVCGIMYHSLHPNGLLNGSGIHVLSMKLLPGIDTDTCFLYVMSNASHDHHSWMQLSESFCCLLICLKWRRIYMTNCQCMREFLISFRFVLTESIWKGIRLSDSCDRFLFF